MVDVRFADAGELDQGAVIALYDAVGWSVYTRDSAKLSAHDGSLHAFVRFD
jgi:hypothetical protein